MRAHRPAALFLLALLPLVASCGAPEQGPPGPEPSNSARLDEERWLGEALTVENVVVWPVYTDRPLDLGDFLTLEEAEAAGKARVREVGGAAGGNAQVAQQGQVLVQEELDAQEDGAGTVESADAVGQGLNDHEQVENDTVQVDNDAAQMRNGQTLGQVVGGAGPTVGTLVIENDSDLPILVVAGTIVKGGQQDRQLAQDLVIAAHTAIPVEAFCVEPGRWSTRAGDDGVAFQQRGLGVAAKSVRMKAQYAKDQQEVWNEVREVLDKKGIQATSTFVAAVEEDDAEAQARREAIESAIRRHFEALAASDRQPVGFAYAVNGEIQSVRAFAHPRLLGDHLPAFVQAMALEADLERGEAKRPTSAADVVAFVAALNAAQEEIQATQAMNALGVRENKEGYNGRCYLPGEEGTEAPRTVTVDWTKK